jgi:uncharacterized protein
MQNPLLRVVDAWLRRAWSPDPAALARVETGEPATVVTGASEGIGRALAREFAAAGHRVVLIGRDSGRLAEAAEGIARDYRVEPVPVPLDVTAPDAAERIAQALRERGLYADILVNNAGVGLSGPLVDYDPAELAQLVDLNVRALTLLTRRFLPDMCVRGRGGVLNVASLGGYTPGPYEAAYYASKAYVLSLTQAIAWEVRGQGVRVAVLAPGQVDTAFHTKMRSEHSLYRLLLPTSSPEGIARSALRGFVWGRSVLTPGPVTSSLAFALRIMPTIIALPLMGWLLAPREEDDARH